LPSFRLTNTWFGEVWDAEGELCYAIQTHARMMIEDMPVSQVRAITAVTIRNRGTQYLEVERIKLPMRYLALYVDPHKNLFTQPVTFESGEQQGDLVAMRIGDGPLDKSHTLLSEAREQVEKGGFLRAMHQLLR